MKTQEAKGVTWKNLLIAAVLLIGCVVFYFGVYRKANEPVAVLDRTNAAPAVHTLSEVTEILMQYDDFFTEEMVEHLSLEQNFGTYIIPGLKSTRTVNSKTGQSDICTSMTPQGMDVTEDSIFVSAYCHTKKHNSVLYQIDKKSGRFVKEIIMPNRTHAGGIAYDNLNQVLWVSDMLNGEAAVSLYTMEALENYQYDKTKKPLPFLETHVLEGLTRNSFMAFRGGSLYAGYDVSEMCASEQVVARKMTPQVPLALDREKSIEQIGNPVKLSESPVEYRHTAYPSGYHTRDILGAIGFSNQEIQDISQ